MRAAHDEVRNDPPQPECDHHTADTRLQRYQQAGDDLDDADSVHELLRRDRQGAPRAWPAGPGPGRGGGGGDFVVPPPAERGMNANISIWYAGLTARSVPVRTTSLRR